MRSIDPTKDEIFDGFLNEIRVLKDSGHDDHEILMVLGSVFIHHGIKNWGLRRFIATMFALLTTRLDDKSIKL
jgi:hypothetical protein